ncbi:unnamed protein product, partial [Allacma fusca]
MLATQFSSHADLNVVSCGIFEGTIPIEYIQNPEMLRVQGFSFWTADKNFDIKNHVRKYDYKGILALPNPCTPADLNRVLSQLLRAPGDRSRSPWECLIVHNYLKNPKSEPGKLHSILLGRFDRGPGGAYGLAEEMRLLMRTPFQFPKIKLGDTRRMPLWKKIKLCLRLPYDTAANLYMGMGVEILGGKTTDFKSEVAFS